MALKNTALTSKTYSDSAVFEEILIDTILQDFAAFQMPNTFSNLFHYVVAKINQAGITNAFEEKLSDLSDYIVGTGEAATILLRQIAESDTISDATLQRLPYLNKLHYLSESVMDGRYGFSLGSELECDMKSFRIAMSPYRLLEKSGRFFSLLMNFHGTCQHAGIDPTKFETLCENINRQLKAYAITFETDATWLAVIAEQDKLSKELDRFRELLQIVIDGFERFTQFTTWNPETYRHEFPCISIELPSLIQNEIPLKEIADYLEDVGGFGQEMPF